ncbi:hypothetical protein ACWDO7_08875 [Streptomyces sp. NPDC003656]|uniref:hypothetical protein n=1 Tax=Streptomyces sp. NPDC091385 TaxID=3365997 RepID=UPI0037FE77AE
MELVEIARELMLERHPGANIKFRHRRPPLRNDTAPKKRGPVGGAAGAVAVAFYVC